MEATKSGLQAVSESATAAPEEGPASTTSILPAKNTLGGAGPAFGGGDPIRRALGPSEGLGRFLVMYFPSGVCRSSSRLRPSASACRATCHSPHGHSGHNCKLGMRAL